MPEITARSGPQLGKLARLVAFLAERQVAVPARPRLVIVAGDHGVAAAGLSAQPAGATAQAVDRVSNSVARTAGRADPATPVGTEIVAVLAEIAGAGVVVVDLSVDRAETDAASPYRAPPPTGCAAAAAGSTSRMR
jgi:nicotinate-nucleotide--dimethylbenzimidazole phosphoribosyltransferase